MNTQPTRQVQRILLAGGTGLIGRRLCHHLLDRGDEVVILTRDPGQAPDSTDDAALLPWQPGTKGLWARELDGIDAVVNLAGAPFFTRWKGNYYQEQVLRSRRAAIDSLVNAIATSKASVTFALASSSVHP